MLKAVGLDKVKQKRDASPWNKYTSSSVLGVALQKVMTDSSRQLAAGCSVITLQQLNYSYVLRYGTERLMET